MAELATIARPYADALFDAASASGQADAWGEKLDALSAVASDPSMQGFADNPTVSHDAVFKMMVGVTGDALDDESGRHVGNFLRTVIDNGRLAALPEIAMQYRELLSQQHGVADAVIHSAYPISDSELSDLVATLERRFRRKLRASVDIVPELIGGVRVSVGDEVLDTSVQGQLDRMKAALTA